MRSIPVSVVVVTKNEEANIARCLDALQDFSELIVVDSASKDKTAKIARQKGARVFPFHWNGRYPKKRQWVLNHIDLSYDWVFFVDADEVVTPALIREIKKLFEKTPKCAGYFIKGRYVWNGRKLRFGLRNNKLALIDRRCAEFPEIDDLDIKGMGEVEGHYQPVLKAEAKGRRVGSLRSSLIHYAAEDPARWVARHKGYAVWQAEVNRRGILPGEVTGLRRILKKVFAGNSFAPLAAFFHSYVFKLGILDGVEGWNFAASRAFYYKEIKRQSR